MNHKRFRRIMPGVYQIIPCNCPECTDTQAHEKQFESFLERLNRQYEEFYGRAAPSYVEYTRKQNSRET